jgi:hypothetical protein
LIHDLFDRVKAMDDQSIAELVPSLVFTVLHANIDKNKRLLQMSLLRYPLGKPGIEII